MGPDLKRYMDKKLALKLNGSRHITGKLRGFDQFMNLVLDETVEHVSATERNDIGMVCDKPSRARARAHTHTHTHTLVSTKPSHGKSASTGCVPIVGVPDCRHSNSSLQPPVGRLPLWYWGSFGNSGCGGAGSVARFLSAPRWEGLVFPVSVRRSVSLTSPCLYRWSCVATASSQSRPSRNSGTTCHRPTGRRLRPP